MAKVLVAGDWQDNYLKLGGSAENLGTVVHVGVENLSRAQAEAGRVVEAKVAEAVIQERAQREAAERAVRELQSEIEVLRAELAASVPPPVDPA